MEIKGEKSPKYRMKYTPGRLPEVHPASAHFPDEKAPPRGDRPAFSRFADEPRGLRPGRAVSGRPGPGTRRLRAVPPAAATRRRAEHAADAGPRAPKAPPGQRHLREREDSLDVTD